MKNYYAEFLQNKNVNTLESEVSKVSKAVFSLEIRPFDTFDTSPYKINQKIFVAGTLAEQLSVMFPGASAEVSIDDFQITGADELTAAQKDFISVNKMPILCTLQQSGLVRRLFSGRPELQEIFIEKIREKGGTLEAAAEITANWFARLIETMSDRKAEQLKI